MSANYETSGVAVTMQRVMAFIHRTQPIGQVYLSRTQPFAVKCLLTINMDMVFGCTVRWRFHSIREFSELFIVLVTVYRIWVLNRGTQPAD